MKEELSNLDLRAVDQRVRYAILAFDKALEETGLARDEGAGTIRLSLTRSGVALRWTARIFEMGK